MKEKLLKVLHFFKLDVLLLRVLERLSTGLTKKHEAFKAAVECFVYCRLSATNEEPPISSIAEEGESCF